MRSHKYKEKDSNSMPAYTFVDEDDEDEDINMIGSDEGKEDPLLSDDDII